MIDVLIIYNKKTEKEVLGDTLRIVKDLLKDEHGLVKMTHTELTEDNLEKYSDFNIVVGNKPPESHIISDSAKEYAILTLDVEYNLIDTWSFSTGWDFDNTPYDLLQFGVLEKTMERLNEELLLDY